MKEKIFCFLRNYKKAFIPAKNLMKKEIEEVSDVVNKKLAETNCRRIIAISPVIFLLYVLNVMFMLMHKDTEYFIGSMVITGILAAFTLFTDGAICWLIFFDKIDNDKEMWKFRVVYRIFWPIWFVCMALLSFIQMENGGMGIFLIITCLILNLLPLHNLKEFIVNLVLSMLVISLILFNNMGQGINLSKKMEIACFTVMQVLGYLIQRMQLMLWMSREYLYIEAFVDPLTELLNRRGGNAVLAEEMQKISPESEVGIIMFDIDYFKKYNDTFGHDAGDGCLRMVGQTIRETLHNRTKLLIRHGGEEFAAIIFNTDKNELKQWAEKLRAAVYAKKLEAPVKDVSDYVTVSIGTSIKRIMCKNMRYEELLIEADEALYQAKRAGRNQVAFIGE